MFGGVSSVLLGVCGGVEGGGDTFSVVTAVVLCCVLVGFIVDEVTSFVTAKLVC